MAHAGRHHGGGGWLATLISAGLLALVLLIGWAVWSGYTPGVDRDMVNIDRIVPAVPTLPTTPDPQPLPMPRPSQPG